MLTIVRGLPGSGKSTYVRDHFPGVFHVENDMLHVKDGAYRFDQSRQMTAVTWCYEMIERALEHGMDAVISNTFTQRRFILPYVELCERLNIPYRVIRMETQYGNIHDVPADVMKRMTDSFEAWEGEEVVR